MLRTSKQFPLEGLADQSTSWGFSNSLHFTGENIRPTLVPVSKIQILAWTLSSWQGQSVLVLVVCFWPPSIFINLLMIGHSAKKVDWKAIASYNLVLYIYNCLWFFLPHSYILVFFFIDCSVISLLIIMYYFSVWMCAVSPNCVCACVFVPVPRMFNVYKLYKKIHGEPIPEDYPLVVTYSWITEQIWNTCSTSLVDLSWYIFPEVK